MCARRTHLHLCAALLVLAPGLSVGAPADATAPAVSEQDVFKALGPLSDEDLERITSVCLAEQTAGLCANTMKGLEKQVAERLVTEKELLQQFAEKVSVMSTQILALRGKFAKELTLLSAEITAMKREAAAREAQVKDLNAEVSALRNASVLNSARAQVAEEAAELSDALHDARAERRHESAESSSKAVLEALRDAKAEDGSGESQATEQTVTFLVDDTLLASSAPGVAYRHTMDLNDKDPTAYARYGSTVAGVRANDDWVRVGQKFLPVHIGGKQVLRRLAGASLSDSLADVEGRLQELMGSVRAEEKATGRSQQKRLLSLEKRIGELRSTLATAESKAREEKEELDLFKPEAAQCPPEVRRQCCGAFVQLGDLRPQGVVSAAEVPAPSSGRSSAKARSQSAPAPADAAAATDADEPVQAPEEREGEVPGAARGHQSRRRRRTMFGSV